MELTTAEAKGPRRLAVVAATIGYAIACQVMLAPIFNFQHLATANYEGDARLIIWTLAWDNHVIVDGVRRWFDANIFYPAPDALAYSEHLFGISVFTLPVYAVTRNPVLAYNLVWLGCFLLAAIAGHLLAWRYTRDHLASTIAGLSFAFCFYRMHHGHGHLHMVWSFWIPISLVLVARWMDRPTWRLAALFVMVTVLQALASWYQGVMIFVADALFMIWTSVAGQGPAPVRWWNDQQSRRRFGRFLVQAAVAAIVGIACVWPFARHYSVLRSMGPIEVAGGRADLAGYLVPPENTFAGRWLLQHGVKGPRWIWGELTLYLGWTTLALAAAGAVVAIRARSTAARESRFFLALAAVAVALALGPSSDEIARNAWGWTPFSLMARLPGVALFRVPARYSELLTLALAVLAAVACGTMHRRWGIAGRAVTVAAIPLILFETYVVNFPGGPPRVFRTPPVYRQLATLAPGPIVSLPDYAGTPAWFLEANYQFFSTTNWRPIVNGYSRAEPPSFRPLMDRLKTFPDADCAAAMRETGVRYLVFHAAAIPNGAALAASAADAPDFRLVGRAGDDYVYEPSDRRRASAARQ